MVVVVVVVVAVVVVVVVVVVLVVVLVVGGVFVWCIFAALRGCLVGVPGAAAASSVHLRLLFELRGRIQPGGGRSAGI